MTIKPHFVLTGFSQETGFRVFRFTLAGPGIPRVEFTVRADLSLLRRYSIPVQDLPLLCRGLLERRDELDESRALIFSEEEMQAHSKECADARLAAAQKRKPPRKPVSENVGSAWRGPNAF